MMIIAFITSNSSLVPFIEGLCSSNPYGFVECNVRPAEGVFIDLVSKPMSKTPVYRTRLNMH